MEELDQLCPPYAGTPQAPNIIAANESHSKFPTDDVVLATIVVSMEGRQIDESEISMHKGQPWREVRICFMNFAILDNLRFCLGV